MGRSLERPPITVRDASDRTRRLRQRTLYETTANQAAAASKRDGATSYENTANGDLRVSVTDRASKTSCLRYSYSQAALLDVNMGSVFSKSRCADTVQLREIHARSSASQTHGGLYEASQTLTRYHDATALLTDTSLNAGNYNRIIYEPNARLSSTSGAFPGLVVDPSGEVLSQPYMLSDYVDICGSIASDLSLSAPPSSASVSAYVRATAEMATLDVCLGFPFGRTRFVGL